VLGPVALPDVVARVVKEQRLAALARMVTFQATLRPATVIGDAEKLRTIVDNLLSNAIKYSPRNATVDLSVGIKDGFAVLDVIDHGRGVVAADRNRIFESFYQGPPPVDGRIKGSGLGLAIAREYALAQGGRIDVAGRMDGKSGAWFRLSLPLAVADTQRKQSPVPATALAGK
jgi:two-component system, NtrC family, sensor histidine kinase GlrK